MLATRIGLAGALERSDEEQPLADAVLALSASAAAVMAFLDVAAGLIPLTALPAIAIGVGHVLHRRRVGILAAIAVWIAILRLDPGGLVAALMMLGVCVALLVGPDRAIDLLEDLWQARTERIRDEEAARVSAALAADGVETVGWIEDDPRYS
jgi:hypothetical protein